ncbi:hypothetical protein [Sphingobium sp. TCM1]|uniref:hypothetical protein n=1 Tax=Sphingobium sp. TCM1 TaxID=453246 RepID=UPI0007F41E70|nr:hypothetical protein [Sphingobium sp. TCM1]OAN58676.1 hypothetical protein A7Q26_13640 [Sphingobium sp. TCM1]
MPLPSLHDLAPLADLSALCAAIMASPAIRDMLLPPLPTAHIPEIPMGITCGEIIAAIYDLLEGTPFAPYAAEIVGAVLTRSAAFAGIRASLH